MNNQFNYAGFVEMFLESDDEHEPYGFGEPVPHPAADRNSMPYLLPPPE